MPEFYFLHVGVGFLMRELYFLHVGVGFLMHELYFVHVCGCGNFGWVTLKCGNRSTEMEVQK